MISTGRGLFTTVVSSAKCHLTFPSSNPMACISYAILRLVSPTAAALPSRKLSLPILIRRKVSAAYPALPLSETGEIRSTELVAREYADLNLPDRLCKEVGHVRIRQHVNPLSSSSMIPVDVPDWNAVYEDSTLPLMVDIGCGSGRFLMWHAKRNPGLRNYLGLEIRPKLVRRAGHCVNELGLKNIHFIFANATVSFKQLVSTYPGPLVLVSILCPDPYFKRKHHKRRVVQKPLVESIIELVVPGGKIFIQSDVLDVALDMRSNFDAESNRLVHIDSINGDMLCDHDGWLLSNPMGIRTEREIHEELKGARIFRRMYQKLS
ncbi:tRNA (guanine-N-7) methyltransferase [Striga hermonthica]|uniref:tRNA (guanine(46)-N(7))-methyltransferase n=1 Tax=Striga hermonthica TaxID=68872 RepID=A0A9N7RR09_STRHE|nr:tRNA (guanine-N-7) methyltransferase [Striga hermonthica]